MDKLRLILIVVLVISLVLLSLFIFLSKKVLTPSLSKEITLKMERLFSTNVNFDKIGLTPFFQVRVKDLQIDQSIRQRLFYVLNIGEVLFNYHLFDLFKGKLDRPKEMKLKTPHFVLNSLVFPLPLFQPSFLKDIDFQSAPEISISKGKLDFKLAEYNFILSLADINARLINLNDGWTNLNLEASAAKASQGNIVISGRLRPERDEYDLTLEIKNLKFKGGQNIFQEIDGTIRIRNSELIVENLSLLVHNLPLTINGTISNFENLPFLNLHFRLQGGEISSTFNLKGDVRNSTLEGELNFLGLHYEFRGNVVPELGGFLLRNLIFNNDYQAQGNIDIKKGVYRIYLEKAKQRIDLTCGIKDFNLAIKLNLEHIKFLDFDIITYAHLNIKPNRLFWEENQLIFDCELKTDYLIFDYIPLRDFNGSFQLSFQEVNNINASWGENYTLVGNLKFKSPYFADLKLKFKDIDLKDVDTLGIYALPPDLEGLMNGETKITGEIKEPNIEGYLTIQQGKWEKFDFDQLNLDFYGGRNDLRLKNSNLKRGKNIFYIKGDIDFTLDNIFQNVKILSPDHIVIWKGWDLTRRLGEEEISLHKDLGERFRLIFKTTNLGMETGKLSSTIGGKAEAEYKVGKGKSISVVAEEEKGEEYLTVGPKFKF